LKQFWNWPKIEFSLKIFEENCNYISTLVVIIVQSFEDFTLFQCRFVKELENYLIFRLKNPHHNGYFDIYWLHTDLLMLEFVITTEKKKCSYVEKITRIIKIASLLSVLVVFWINVRRVVKYGMSLVATMQNVQKDLWATVDRNININKTQIPTSMIFYFWNFYKFVYL
jgi:hypothetical protein